MRKNKLTTVSVLLLSLLLSGCNSTVDSELDELIKNLPAAQISDDKINFDPVSEVDNNTPFLSVTGNVISVSSKEIIVKYDSKEYKFTIDEDTKVFGGEIKESEAVTVTYEGDLSDKTLTAKIITVLLGDSEDNSSEAPPVTAGDEPDETTKPQTAPELSTVEQDITESTAEEMTSVSETAVADETAATSSDISA